MMAALQDVQVFADAGWDAKKCGKDAYRALASNGVISTELVWLTNSGDELLLTLGYVKTGEILAYTIANDDRMQEAARVLIREQPGVNKKNFRELIHQLLLVGASVKADVDGYWVPVTLEEGESASGSSNRDRPRRRWWQSRRSRP